MFVCGQSGLKQSPIRRKGNEKNQSHKILCNYTTLKFCVLAKNQYICILYLTLLFENLLPWFNF